MSTSEPLLFDTNILVYNQDQDSAQYNKASEWHKKALTGTINAVIATQNILEFAAVMKNPQKIGRPLTQKQIVTEIENYQRSGAFSFIYPNEKTLFFFKNLLRKISLKNPRQAFDVFLVGTMLSNGVKRILTNNPKDFRDFSQIRIISL